MKKRTLMLAASMTVFGLLTGCVSGKEGAQPAETITGAAETLTEAEPETEEENDSEQAAGTEDMEESEAAQEIADARRIWGAIEQVGEGELIVDNQSHNSSMGEMIIKIDPEQTKILDAVEGLPVELDEITGDSFEAYLGPTMTMSLPPQTTAELVIVNIPQDAPAPLYVTARGPIEETELGTTLMTEAGVTYVLTEETQILPYLTRNIVRAEDIMEGSNCLIWQDADGAVEKLVLFAE